MKRALALFFFGLIALVAQGALATIVRPPYCPDLALLAVIAIGLHWEGLASGLVMSALLGYATDLLSGSLLGQHTLLRLFAFAAARLGSQQLNLRGALPLAVFTSGGTLLYAACALALTSVFSTAASLAWSGVGDLVVHAFVNALFAPLASSMVRGLCVRLGEEDASRRSLRFEPPGRAA